MQKSQQIKEHLLGYDDDQNSMNSLIKTGSFNHGYLIP